MECFVITVSVFQSLTIITKPSILDVAAALDTSPILAIYKIKNSDFFCRIPEVSFLRKRVYYCTGWKTLVPIDVKYVKKHVKYVESNV